MFNKKSTWITVVIISLLLGVTAYKIFPKAFPILNIKLEMSRDDANNLALQLSKKYSIGPVDNFQVSTFGVDGKAQNFIELDQGGSKKFIEILDNKYYEAYSWKVRHYEPGNANEAWFTFTPEGKIYGFHETLSDDLFIDNLNQDQALSFAISESNNNWNVNLSNYELVEKSQDKKPSNRIDHTFVYKRNDIDLGEGEYRLKLTVSGNKLTQVEHFIKIPETFNRKYEEMRSFNNTIANTASYALYILYFLGGVVGGLFILNRQRWLLWKTGIYWGIFIASVMLLSGLNFLPLSWLSYDTAVSVQNFMLQNILFSLINFIVMVIYLTLSFVAAESLTRKAFPHHIQFWKLWSKENAYTQEVVGQTLGGYLMIFFDLFFVISFYAITSNYFGWWTPAGTLFQPDMIATPFPWLSAVGMSLHAGFWEECLFRAVPLAGAALIGRKYGREKLFIGIGMVVQAIIFAAAHASYPSYPSYSRLIELIIPSFIFGFLYLRFGLLPAIISHFGYDAILFSIPIFASSASGILFDKFMVFFLIFIPVWVIIRSKISNKTFSSIDKSNFNSAFKPPKESKTKNVIKEKSSDLRINKNYKKTIYFGAIAGLILLLTYRPSEYLNLDLEISRNKAIDLSRQYLEDNNINLDKNWTILTKLQNGKVDNPDKYIWQNEDKNIYDLILGKYLDSYLWKIRYVKFEGNVNDKTEEYAVLINNDGSFNQIWHKIPENREGVRLNEEDSRTIALNHINNKFGLSSKDLTEISLIQSNLPNRDDWEYICNDETYDLKSDGQLRIKVNISGDEITSTYRYVHIPEEWSRNEEDKNTFNGLLKTISYFAFIFFTLYAGATSFSAWSNKKFNINIFKESLYLLGGFGLLNIINKYPSIIDDFSTAKPFMNQILTSIPGSVIFIIFMVLLLSTILGNISSNIPKPTHKFSLFEILLVGISMIGFMLYAYNNSTDLYPIWINNGGIHTNTLVPILSHLNSAIYTFMNNTIILLFLVFIINSLTDYNRKNTYLVYLIPFIFILLYTTLDFGGNSGIDSFVSLLFVTSFLKFIFYLIYTKYLIFDLTILPLLTAFMISINLISDSFTNAYPSILTGNVISAIFILFLGYHFRNMLIKRS